MLFKVCTFIQTEEFDVFKLNRKHLKVKEREQKNTFVDPAANIVQVTNYIKLY